MTFVAKLLTRTATGGALMAAGLGCTSEVDGPGETPVDCTPYWDESPPHVVDVTIRNATAAPLFLSNDQLRVNYIALLLTLPDGLWREWRRTGCTCEDRQEKDQEDCTSSDSMLPRPAPIVYIEPGGAHVAGWSGLHQDWSNMPTACWQDPWSSDPSHTCVQQVAAGEGEYTLTTLGWDEVESCELDVCECGTDADGSCRLAGEPWTVGRPREASVTFPYLDTTAVEIVYD